MGTEAPHKETHHIPHRVEVNPYITVPAPAPAPAAPQPVPEKAPELVPA